MSVPDDSAIQEGSGPLSTGGSVRHPWRDGLRGSVVGAVSVILLAIAGAIAGWVNLHWGESARATGVSTTAANTTATIQISIDPPTGSVPLCVHVTGTATMPPGTTVWLLQQPAGDSNYYGLAEANLDPSHPGVWSKTVGLGRPGDVPAGQSKTFTIYAFAVDRQTTRLLESFQLDSGGVPFPARRPRQRVARPDVRTRQQTKRWQRHLLNRSHVTHGGRAFVVSIRRSTYRQPFGAGNATYVSHDIDHGRRATMSGRLPGNGERLAGIPGSACVSGGEILYGARRWTMWW